MINEIFVRKIDFSDALLSLFPGTVWKVINDPNDYNNVIWEDEKVSKPSEDVLRAEVVRLQSIQDAEIYRLKRAPEYPSIGDQLDALFHAGVFPPEMAAQIQAVKDKYPKGS